MDFLWGHYKDHVHAISSRTVEDLVAQLEVTLIAADAIMLTRVGEHNLLSTAVCFEMDGDRFEHLFHYEAPVV
jgi:hypothetical protein